MSVKPKRVIDFLTGSSVTSNSYCGERVKIGLKLDFTRTRTSAPMCAPERVSFGAGRARQRRIFF